VTQFLAPKVLELWEERVFFSFLTISKNVSFLRFIFTTLLSVNIVGKTLFYHYVNNMMEINPLKYLSPKLVQYNDESCLRHKE
jgi:hypothetical protein